MRPVTVDNNPTLHITGHNVEVTPALKNHIEEKVRKLNHHFAKIIDIRVTLTIEKGDKRVQERKELHKASAHILLPPHSDIFAEAASKDMYASVDVLIDKLDRQINKHKEKLKDKD